MEIVGDSGFGPSWDLVGYEEEERIDRYAGADHSVHDGPDAPPGYYGECPLCNNEKGPELDRLCVTGRLKELWAMGFTKGEVARHLLHHCGPVFARLGAPVFADLTDEDIGNIRGRLDEAAEALVRASKRHANGEARRMKAGREAMDEEGMGLYPAGYEWMRKQFSGRPRVDHGEMDRLARDVAVSRDRGYSPPRVYAFRLGRQLGQPAPWTHERSAIEMEERQREVINFYDEMMDIRQKTRDIYDRIMGRRVVTRDEDGAEIVEYVGGLVNKEPKTITAAVGVVKAMSGVMDTLLDASLIIKKIGDDSKGEELDPALKAIVDQIGLRSVGRDSAKPAIAPDRGETPSPPCGLEPGADSEMEVTVEVVEDARD